MATDHAAGPSNAVPDHMDQVQADDEGPIAMVQQAQADGEGPGVLQAQADGEGPRVLQAQADDEGPSSSTPTLSASPVDASTVDVADDVGSVESGSMLQFTTCVVPEGMTKKQWKKQIRQQRKMVQKEESKLRRKEKVKAQRAKRRLYKERKEALLAQEKAQAEREGRPWSPPRKRPGPDIAPSKKKRFKKMSSSEASPYKVAIDFSFEDLMTDKDIKMLMKQCQRCYSENRRAGAPLQFYWTNFGGRSEARLAAVMSYKNWDVHMKPHGYIEEFGKENVVFLTSESPNTLTDLDPSKAYIIGGLVDHNHHKGYCFKRAVEQGVAHAKLPISDYVKLNCRTVLAINHVFEILLAFSQNKDWKKSFDDIIPARKVTSDDNELTQSHDSVAQSSSAIDADEIEEHSSPCLSASDSPQQILVFHHNAEPDVDVTTSLPKQSSLDSGDKSSTENSHLDNCTVNVTTA